MNVRLLIKISSIKLQGNTGFNLGGVYRACLLVCPFDEKFLPHCLFLSSLVRWLVPYTATPQVPGSILGWARLTQPFIP